MGWLGWGLKGGNARKMSKKAIYRSPFFLKGFLAMRGNQDFTSTRHGIGKPAKDFCGMGFCAEHHFWGGMRMRGGFHGMGCLWG